LAGRLSYGRNRLLRGLDVVVRQLQGTGVRVRRIGSRIVSRAGLLAALVLAAVGVTMAMTIPATADQNEDQVRLGQECASHLNRSAATMTSSGGANASILVLSRGQSRTDVGRIHVTDGSPKMIWRTPEESGYQLRAIHSDGTIISTFSRPQSHLGSNWCAEGHEWESSPVFPSVGEWTIELKSASDTWEFVIVYESTG